MHETSLQNQRILDALWTVALVSALMVVLYLVTSDHDERIVRSVILLAALAGMQAIWMRLRRPGRRPLSTVVFLLLALVCSITGDVLISMFPTFVALVMIMLTFGARVSAVLVAGLVVIDFAMRVATGADAEWVVVNLVAMISMLTFVFFIGLLIRRSTADSARRAQLLAELQETHAELQRSIETEKELVLAQERARSARELHDGLGHRLTLIGMALDFAERSRDTRPARAWEEVATARRQAGEAMAEMRLWVRALNPVPVAGLEGITALNAVAEAFRGTGVDVRLSVRGEERPLDRNLLLFCHRFVQEGLTNALRHARATMVEVVVHFEPDQLHLSLQDNGAGSAPQQLGFGLRSLTERAEALGGTVQVDENNRGVQLRACVALNAEVAAR